jgi:lysophospholipase L1-like esterase
MKIVFLGDSLTWGGYGGNYVEALRQRLPNHQLINAGQGGNTIINLYRRLDAVLAQQPDGVFVMTGGNEAIASLYPATRPYYKKSQQLADGWVTPEQFSQTYRDLLATLQLQHVLAWVGLPPAEYSAELVVRLKEYNALAQAAADSLNIPTLDLMGRFLRHEPAPRPPLSLRAINQIGERTSSGWNDYETERQAGGFTFTFDGLHLTPDSAQQVAEAIAAFIEHR